MSKEWETIKKGTKKNWKQVAKDSTPAPAKHKALQKVGGGHLGSKGYAKTMKQFEVPSNYSKLRKAIRDSK